MHPTLVFAQTLAILPNKKWEKYCHQRLFLSHDVMDVFYLTWLFIRLGIGATTQNVQVFYQQQGFSMNSEV